MKSVCPICSLPSNTLTPIVINTKRNAIFRTYVCENCAMYIKSRGRYEH